MQRVQEKESPANSAAWRLPRLSLLLGALVAAGAATGAATGQQALPSGAADSSYAVRPTTYRVINLGSSLLATIPDINAKGQVSFSLQTGSSMAAGYFYNGSTVQNIGTLGGGEVLANDLNDVGQIAGRSTNGFGIEHAFVWSAGGGMLDLGVLPGASESAAAAINNVGVVTGTSDGVPVQPPHAFRWSLASGIEDLGAFTTGLTGESFGSALNDAGLIAGTATTASDDRQAFAWTRTSGLVNIDTLNSYDSLVVAVGAKGEVAGNHIASTASFLYHPFLWRPGAGMVDLGTTGGTEAFVIAMTPRLHMAGVIDLADGTQRAMSWTPATGMRRLGTFGGPSSRAIDVNARGQLVGYADNKAGDMRAFVWTAKHGMLDLNKYLRHAPPGLVLDDAVAINDSGTIVATSNAGLVLLRPDSGCTCGHALGPVVAPAIVKAGAPLQASIDFVDEDKVGTRSVNWSWGDGSAEQAGNVRESGGAGKASAGHNFAAPGIYTVTATVVDRSGASTAVSRKVVVTGASGGMAAGDGMVMSPAGAFGKAPTYAGKAHFSLIAPVAAAKAAGAQSVPARLDFDMPGLNFRSQDVRLLGRQGAQHVFVGSGTVRGAGSYQFRLSTSAVTVGSGQGRFALKIWHTDPASKADVVDYDNTRAASGSEGARVTDGSIVVE
jgi:probable HAF family extracellular repeat protein